MIVRQAAHSRLSLEKDQNVSNKTTSKEARIKPWPQNEWKVSNLKLNSWEKKLLFHLNKQQFEKNLEPMT